MNASQVNALDGAGVLAAIAALDPNRFVLVMDGPDVQLHYLRARAASTSVWAHYSSVYQMTLGANFRQILEQDLDGVNVSHGIHHHTQGTVAFVTESHVIGSRIAPKWSYSATGQSTDRLGLLARCWLFAYFKVPNLGESTVQMEREEGL